MLHLLSEGADPMSLWLQICLPPKPTFFSYIYRNTSPEKSLQEKWRDDSQCYVLESIKHRKETQQGLQVLHYFGVYISGVSK